MSDSDKALEASKQTWERIMRERGHDPVTLADGSLDIFAADYVGAHNGPRCKKCGWQCCWHCDYQPRKAIPKTCQG